MLECLFECLRKTVPLFTPLESYDLMQLADCLQQQPLEAGQPLFKRL